MKPQAGPWNEWFAAAALRRRASGGRKKAPGEPGLWKGNSPGQTGTVVRLREEEGGD